MKKIIILPLILSVILLAFVFKSGSNKSPQQSTSQADVTNTSKVTPDTSSSSKSLDLVINEPISGIEVQENSIIIKGQVNPKARVIVNETDVTLRANGEFAQHVTLDEGENYISIVAYDDEGNATERELLIIRTIEGI